MDEFIVQRGIAVHEFGKHIGVAFTGEEEGPPQPFEARGTVIENGQLVSEAELPNVGADIVDVKEQPAQMGQRRDTGASPRVMPPAAGPRGEEQRRAVGQLLRPRGKDMDMRAVSRHRQRGQAEPPQHFRRPVRGRRVGHRDGKRFVEQMVPFCRQNKGAAPLVYLDQPQGYQVLNIPFRKETVNGRGQDMTAPPDQAQQIEIGLTEDHISPPRSRSCGAPKPPLRRSRRKDAFGAFRACFYGAPDGPPYM